MPAVSRRVIAGLHGIVLILSGLQAYVRTLPATLDALPTNTEAERFWWGLWPIRVLPDWLFGLSSGLLLVSIGGAWWYVLRRRPTAQPLAIFARRWGWLAAWGFITLVLVAFFAFPIAHTRWGDAYLLTHAIAWPDPAQRLTHSWQAPLDVFLHSQLWLWGHGRFGWETATPAYRWLSPLAGALYLATVMALSRRLAPSPRWLTIGLLTTLGLLQLFFGYVENYSFAAVGILAYLWLGLGVVRGEQPLWLAAAMLAVTNATHPSTLILGPSLLYLGWVRLKSAPAGTNAWGSVVFSIIGPLALIGGATIALMTWGGHGLIALVTTDRPGGGDARFFVPLWETSTRWEQYTMASWPHLRDLLNQQLLVAPVVWPSLLWFWVTLRRSLRAGSPESLFLRIAALAYLLLICTWNPDYGGQRDWDLFSLAALPATLWLLHWLPRALPNPQQLLAATLPLMLYQGLHTLSWLYQNTLPWAWP